MTESLLLLYKDKIHLYDKDGADGFKIIQMLRRKVFGPQEEKRDKEKM